MNNNQLKYVAEIIKITSVAEFGYFGVTALDSHNWLMLYASAIVFLYLVLIGIFVLGFVKE